MMRKIFHYQLEKLNLEMIEMASLCEESFRYLLDVLDHGEKESLEHCSYNEKKINGKERKIENLALKILLEQQPVAKDLRFVSASLRVVADLERIGDQIEDIASVVKILGENIDFFMPDLLRMGNIVYEMMKMTIHSLVKKERQNAQEVIEKDDEVDACFVEMKNRAIDFIQNHNHAESAVDL